MRCSSSETSAWKGCVCTAESDVVMRLPGQSKGENRDITRWDGGSRGREQPSLPAAEAACPLTCPLAWGDQVTQRPGWSSLATSVRELTIGSQAMVGLLRPCF
ncbi:hypothetical protein ACVI8L_008087 [Bradyrhizobium diazoefficiens]